MAKATVIRVNRNLARRLREARRETGLSTRAVADKLPRSLTVSHSTIASYENGTTTPPVNVLAALADIYHRPLNWFLDDRISLTSFRYRNLKSRAPVIEQRNFEALAGKWAEAYLKLGQFLHGRFTTKKPSVEKADDIAPELLAARVRQHLGLDDDDPIQNVVSVLESCHVWAMEIKTSLGFDGATAKHDGEFVVMLNPGVSNDRLRMNAAHEVAHILYDDCKQNLGWSDNVVEKMAYTFASSLLLPETQLKTAFEGKSFLKLIQFKERFGISLSAMIHRAEQSRIINTTTSRWLWVEMTKRGWRQDEPGYVWRDRAIRFETMLDCAIQSKAISWPDAERITGIREGELRDRITSAILPSGATMEGRVLEQRTLHFGSLRIAGQLGDDDGSSPGDDGYPLPR